MKHLAHASRGLTLIELLVVIGILVLLFGVVVPGFRNMMGSGRIETAATTLSSAVVVARSYAQVTRPMRRGSFEGSALLVTSTHELRQVEHFDPSSVGLTGPRVGGNPLPAYRDVADESYIHLPRGVGLLGVTLDSDNGNPVFLAPPFAIRFNPQGSLVAVAPDVSAPSSADPRSFVYYDGEYDGSFSNSNRNSPRFNPMTQGDPEHPDFDPVKVFGDSDAAEQAPRARLPFNRVEPVIGVVIYAKNEFRELYPSVTNSKIDPSSEQGKWLVNNGTLVFFNRFTGAMIR